MTRILLGSLLTVAIACAAYVAHSQATSCGPRDVLIFGLADRYGEARNAIGLTGHGEFMEIFVNPETGSWTVAITSPEGVMCFISAGDSFEHVTEPALLGKPL